MTLRRKYEEKFFRVLSAITTLLIVFVLGHILWSIVEKGFTFVGNNFAGTERWFLYGLYLGDLRLIILVN
ncbi:MAG: hypothetical protein ACR2FN_03010 [Chitinophagaceae bacterium]